MPATGHLFGQTEYERRLDRTKAAMEDAGVDALVVSDPENMNYLSGYDAWSFYVFQCLVVMRDRDQPVWVGRACDENCAKATTWLDQENILADSDEHVHSPYDLHPVDYVADVIRELGVDDATVGVEKDAYYFSAYAQERLAKSLPEATFSDQTLLVGWVRVRKTDRERPAAAALRCDHDGIHLPHRNRLYTSERTVITRVPDSML